MSPRTWGSSMLAATTKLGAKPADATSVDTACFGIEHLLACLPSGKRDLKLRQRYLQVYMSSQLVSSVLVLMSQISLLVSQSADFASAGFAADFGAAVAAGPMRISCR